jgi:hypothetical protein
VAVSTIDLHRAWSQIKHIRGCEVGGEIHGQHSGILSQSSRGRQEIGSEKRTACAHEKYGFADFLGLGDLIDGPIGGNVSSGAHSHDPLAHAG